VRKANGEKKGKDGEWVGAYCICVIFMMATAVCITGIETLAKIELKMTASRTVHPSCKQEETEQTNKQTNEG
jgi:hypothetical protein